jgi:nicotinamidase/pyrazinamidase
MISRLGQRIDTILITLDSHQLNHIAHPNWFRDQVGNPPPPFTIMRVEGKRIVGSQLGPDGVQDNGVYTTTQPKLYARTGLYLRDLAAGKRYPHCIWPPHTLIGTPGHNVVEPLMDALLEWSKTSFSIVEFVSKGSNPFVEHFSAVRAEIPDPNDPLTQFNSEFIANMIEGDDILFFGEAGSHGLANTIQDVVNAFGDDSLISKCVLLTDGTDAMPGFEQHLDDFVDGMTRRGMRLTTTADYMG